MVICLDVAKSLSLLRGLFCYVYNDDNIDIEKYLKCFIYNDFISEDCQIIYIDGINNKREMKVIKTSEIDEL